jgi:hypothetical protein
MNLHTSREVFKQYLNKKDPSKKTYCRHSAFKGFFQQLGDSWFLEITPTYHFTRDGRSDYPYREELLKGIKRLDRNPAIVGQLLMWQDILSKNTNSLFNNSEYPFLEFSNLETVSIEVGICDDIWFNTEDSVEKLALAELKNQPRFVGI